MPDPDGLTWLIVEDFTPGIITNSALAYAANNGNTGPVPGKQLGQAQSAVGCIGLPNGGLAPLPGLGSTPIPPPAIPSGSTPFVNGLFVVGPVATGAIQNTDVVIFGIEAFNAPGVVWNFDLFAAYVNPTSGTVTATQTLETKTGLMTSGPSLFIALTGDSTRANSTPTNVGLATVAIGYLRGPSGGGPPFVWLFPDPTTPTSTTPYVLSGDPAFVICHQNRIIALTALPQNWTSYGQSAFEAFNYTDPPNGLSMGTQAEIFVQEHPFGHGTWGSISASQLFLVKHSGGGYVIQGDLNAPTVTRLPGVTSTYGLTSRSASETPYGLVYLSNNRGLWAWSGGVSSQKISNQIDDASFTVPIIPSSPTSGSVSNVVGPSGDVRGWGDWVVITNDWILDTNTGGFWKLTPSATAQPHLYYGVSYDGNTLYASVPQPSVSTAIDMYSRLVPANSYSWESYPMRLGNGPLDHQYTVQEVVVRAQGFGTVEVVLTGVGGATSAAASSPSETLTVFTQAQPSMQMIKTGLVAQDVTVKITSTGSSGYPAPIVYSVALGVGIQNPVSAT